MSHEKVPNGEAEGGPENDAALPDALQAPLYENPGVGDDTIPDEVPS